MQAATSPVHGGSPMMAPSSSASAAGTTPSSSSNSHSPSTDQATIFIANHHRMHNPNDSKLKSNPSFKSRRSSLFGSMLKSKHKHDTHKPARPPTNPRSSVGTTPKPRPSDATTLVADLSPSSNQATPSSPQPDTQSEHTLSLSHEAQAEVYHASGSPPMAPLSSPMDLSQGSSSTASSAPHVKSINFAAIPIEDAAPSTAAIPNPIPMHLSGPAGDVERLSASSPEVSSPPAVHQSAFAPTHEQAETANHIQVAPSSLNGSSDQAATSHDNPHSRLPHPIITRTDTASPEESVDAGTLQQMSMYPEVGRSLSPLPTSQIARGQESTANVHGYTDSPTDLSQSASSFVISPQRFSSLGRRSAAPLGLNNSPPRLMTTRSDAVSHMPTVDESVSARTDRRMSMLDFLTAENVTALSSQLSHASASADDLPRTLQQASRAGPRSSTLAPPSVPLIEASRQLQLETAAARSKALQTRKIDLCDRVCVSVEPLVDRLTMFGSMQSSSNYSLAGTVVVEVPKINVPRLSSAAAVDRTGSTTNSPSVHVESLTVRFVGYSVYVDATGRFNATKLTEVTQDLLQPQGFNCAVELVETGEQTSSPESPTNANGEVNQQTLKYETEFDLSIPGWLPASQRSRFGATFYCVQAAAVVEGQVILSALSGLDGFGGDGSQGQSPSHNAARSLESELHESSPVQSPTVGRESSQSASASVKQRTKKTWLNKTAKQLQLRSSKKSNSADADRAGSSSTALRVLGSKDAVKTLGEPDPLFTKTTEAHNQRLPNGQHSIKSECLSILIRRCRDVVPVPVARLARLATVSQVMRDAATPSLSQSMLDLANLQESSPAETTEEATQIAGSAGANRSQLATSASAPMLLNAHNERQAAAAGQAASPSNDPSAPPASLGDAEAAAQSQPTLAPSPRIDSNPRDWGAPPASMPTEPAALQPTEREPRSVMPRAPSAFDAPRDPAKLAAAASMLTPSATLPNLPSSMSRGSSLLDPRLGNANSPPRTSSRSVSTGRSSVPLRHFVHRPTLHLPPELGVTPDNDAAGGLNFSLTLSLPSHVQVNGPKSDVLSFGVQIEVGRTEGWETLRKYGGIRLKDMELVCLQTERHSSMPSRTFLHAFPVVPPPDDAVYAADLPVVTPTRRLSADVNDAKAAVERRLRQGYDRNLVLDHITLVNKGQAPDPIEHNVERIRTTIVGPPPFALKKCVPEPAKEPTEQGQKAKAKIRINTNMADRPGGPSGSPSRGSPAGSGTNTPDGSSQSAGLSGLRAAFAPAAQVGSGSRSSVMQPVPRALARSNNSSSSSLRQAFQGSDGTAAMQPSRNLSPLASSSSPVAGSRSRRPIPFDLSSPTPVTADGGRGNAVDGPNEEAGEAEAGDTAGNALPTTSLAPGATESRVTGRSGQNADPTSGREPHRSNTQEAWLERSSAATAPAPRMGVSSSVSTRPTAPTAPRRSRFESAISRLSTFASSMLEQPAEPSSAARNQDAQGTSSNTGSGGAGSASIRATYAFAGDDGQGVDLNKGRVRMTINLPLVSSDLDTARRANSAQLVSDFESPYVRIRHKLKVKLGLGLKSNTVNGEDGEEWAQALVMCVPVRFTEAPPKEVQEQFGPVDVVHTSGGTVAPHDASSGNAARTLDGTAAGVGAVAGPADGQSAGAAPPSTFREPLLPAYAQLFREDGSRLADEGEDLPRYPGRMSVVGEIDEDPTSDAAAISNGRGDETTTDCEVPNALPTVDENRATGPSELNNATAADAVPGEEAAQMQASTSTLPRLPSLPALPTSMDRTTSLPGRRLLSRTTSSGIYGLRSTSALYAAAGSSLGVSSESGGTKSRVGSSAFDPLPTRPGMRRRSVTSASLTFSRLTPAEVLDEALVTGAMDDEEDRMEMLRPSHTLDSLNVDSQRDLDGSGQDDDEEDNVGEETGEEEEDVESMDRVNSPGDESESGNTTVRMYSRTGERLNGSEDEEDEEDEEEEVEFGRAL